MNIRNYYRIVHLAFECGLDWAKCPAEIPSSFLKCTRVRNHPGCHLDSSGNDWEDGPEEWKINGKSEIPDHIVEFHDVYIAECVWRGVAPGPLPSDALTGPDRSWQVFNEFVRVEAGRLSGAVRSKDDLQVEDYNGSAADLYRLCKLVNAVVLGDCDAALVERAAKVTPTGFEPA